ncbi:unnamed protein product [Trifolium pratense]|uniref:Uncharacterized protein n=1 Tax=Trifolium pratense TaxID=57577 RepID=A0ACB0J1P0_TRIPR|nr:unnamed protein product [Trifolium pratense]
MPGLDPNIACHQLTVDPLASAVVQRRRSQSPEKAEAAEKAVKDLLEANFISEARYTTWLSNVVLVKKSNGKWRMCVDYTDLNRACPKDSYHLPCIDKLVDNSSGFKLLSFMDAYSGYNQIPMVVADREKTAFMTESGNYYYNVMPFGLKNAGATYQRMMNRVFRGEIGDMLEVYMDDMIVKSHEEIDHTAHLRKVFEQARRHNMRFNPEKCTFGVRAGKFLGFYLTERGIEANPDKCRAFTELPTLSNKKSIQTLNGMLTSLSRFVAKSAQHALPLFKLLRKEAVFEWTDECEQALQHLKKALSEPLVLSRPDVEEVLYIYLSVASEAVRAALVRETTEGQKPVYFTSKALKGPELIYQQIEKVALALINAARRLRHYFLAHTIVVRTDQPIKSLLGRPDMAGRMLKWSLELSEFDIRYESRKALKSQVLADFVAEMTNPSSTTSEADKWTTFVDGASSATGAGAGIILENENGIIIEERILNPAPKMCRRGNSRLHPSRGTRGDQSPAPGREIASQESSPSRILLAHHAARCQRTCQKMQQMSTTWGYALSSSPRAQIYVVAMTFRLVGRGYTWPFHKGTPPKQVSNSRRGLLHQDTTGRCYGQQNTIHGQRNPRLPRCPGDQATFHFRGTPQTNVQAEAANRVILRGLRRRLDQNKKKWVEELESVLWAYRTTPHSTTGETPFRMVYGTEAVIPEEVGEPSRRTEQPLEEEMNDEALREELDLVEEIRTGASLREATLKQKIAARHDVKVIKREFEVGSLVLRRNAKDSQDGKLAANWEGPYRVIDKTENGAYYLEDLRGKKLPRPWNAQKLKQYYS